MSCLGRKTYKNIEVVVFWLLHDVWYIMYVDTIYNGTTIFILRPKGHALTGDTGVVVLFQLGSHFIEWAGKVA